MLIHRLLLLMVVLFPLFEGGLALLRRSKRSEAKAVPEGFIGLLWGVIGASILLALLGQSVPAARIRMSETVHAVLAIGLIGAGLVLRVASILVLGRFFTVDVAIHAGHRLVQSGPYRFVRHPSYTGALLAFLGLGVYFGSYLSLVALMVPTFLAFRGRMIVEEKALLASLGEPYAAYCSRTRRLVPGLY